MAAQRKRSLVQCLKNEKQLITLRADAVTAIKD